MKKLTAVIIIFSIILAGCSSPAQEKNNSTTRFLESMDTVMSLTAYGSGRMEALDAAEKEILRLDDLLSTGKESSEIFILNQKRSAVLSPDSRYLFSRSMSLYNETGGVFDVTIYPLTKLWGFTDKNYHVPNEAELSAVMVNIDCSRVTFDADSGYIALDQGQAIDFGGIAKGYTSQRVVQIFRDNGLESGIISLGGNIQCLGSKPDGSLWNIGIKDPWNKDGGIYAVVSVADKAVITSGGYERYFEDPTSGIVYKHILDPRTGYPAESGLASVTIVTDDGTLGDGLSTALYILGLEKATDFWRDHRSSFDAVLITDSGDLYVTEGISDHFSSEHSYQVIK